MRDEARALEELANIVKNAPLWPGNTISHEGAYQCVRLGWARRNGEGDFIPTVEGVYALARHKEAPQNAEGPEPAMSAPLTHGELQLCDSWWCGRVIFASNAPGLHGWDSISASFETRHEAHAWAEANSKGRRKARTKVLFMNATRSRP